MYVVSRATRTYVDQAGIIRSYDPDNITAGALAGTHCGCQPNALGFLPESPTGKAALFVGVAAAAVGGVIVYRKWKKR